MYGLGSPAYELILDFNPAGFVARRHGSHQTPLGAPLTSQNAGTGVSARNNYSCRPRYSTMQLRLSVRRVYRTCPHRIVLFSQGPRFAVTPSLPRVLKTKTFGGAYGSPLAQVYKRLDMKL